MYSFAYRFEHWSVNDSTTLITIYNNGSWSATAVGTEVTPDRIFKRENRLLAWPDFFSMAFGLPLSGGVDIHESSEHPLRNREILKFED